jgi:dTDP-D-glucose 4,6-dehydratase
MKLLVTGGAGFIGSHFILYWMKNHPDDQIVNIDKLTYAGNLESLASIIDNPRHIFSKVDICDKVQITELFKKYNAALCIQNSMTITSCKSKTGTRIKARCISAPHHSCPSIK